MPVISPYLYIRVILASFATPLLLFRIHQRGSESFYVVKTEKSLLETEQKTEKKKIRQNRIIPPHLMVRTKPYRAKVHYVSTKSCNARDLDQRKIRRKCINY